MQVNFIFRAICKKGFQNDFRFLCNCILPQLQDCSVLLIQWLVLFHLRAKMFLLPLQEHGSEEITIVNPAQFPDKSVVSEYLEPMVLGTILAPDTYTGKIMSLCLVRRAFN